MPAICADFFIGSYRFRLPSDMRDGPLVLFVNDGWYVAYFKKIMEKLTQLDAMRLGVPIIYVGHFSTKTMIAKEIPCKYVCSKMLKMLA